MKPNFLTSCLNGYFDAICQAGNPREEGLFLLTMAELEKMAGDQILANRTSRTPPHLFNEIESHANDEYRHCRQLHAMGLETLAGQDLTASEQGRLRQMTAVAKSFVTGYFGNPYLSEATSRHAAYVHGALTIEQFPFQVYSAYLQKTKLSLVRQNLPGIIADEHQHIQFGRDMRAELDDSQKMDLGKLHQIEKEMCGHLFSRLLQIHSGEKQQGLFCRAVSFDPSFFAAWIQTLGHAEKRAADATESFFSGFEHLRPHFMTEHLADEVRHQKLLHRAILLQRRKFRFNQQFQEIEKLMTTQMFNYQNKIFGYLKRKLENPQLVYFYATSLIENRVFKHYTELKQASNDILVTYALNQILVDEIEHAQMFHNALKAHPDFDAEFLKELKSFENTCFSKMNRAVLSGLGREKGDENVLGETEIKEVGSL